MRTLYLDCAMGAAGDMFTAALLELFENKDEMVKELNAIGIPKVEFIIEDALRSGINGTRSIVKIDGVEEEVSDVDLYNLNEKNHGHVHSHLHEENHHHDHVHTHTHEKDHHHDHDHVHSHNDHHHVHRTMSEISEIVSKLNLSDNIKKDVIEVYNLIAEAESISHNVDIKDIHFHEVGSLDAIADITATCFLIDKLDIDEIISSKINVGGGHVHCAHGILPVPAPATSYILKKIPIYSGEVKSELTTPTGAALLKYFVDEYKDMPVMNVEKIGYGMGKKEFEILNALRIFLGETDDKNDSIYELSLNVDDMTGEEISFAMEKLFEGGAREVYVVPIFMKKSRPASLIKVMCDEKNKEEIIKLIFKHTTTIGIREIETKRYILDRKIYKKNSKIGEYRLKKSIGYGTLREKIEYDDLKSIANKNKMSIGEVREYLKKEESWYFY